MKQETMKRTYFWLPDSLLARIDGQMPVTDSKNQSDYVRKAVAFYSGYVESISSEGYLSETLLNELDRRLKQNEAHISKTIYRLAVELSMVTHVLAAAVNVDEDTLEKLRRKCLRDVKASNGRIRFEESYAHQHSGSEEE